MEILGNEQCKDFMKLTIEFENTEELDKILTLLQQNNISGVNKSSKEVDTRIFENTIRTEQQQFDPTLQLIRIPTEKWKKK